MSSGLSVLPLANLALYWAFKGGLMVLKVSPPPTPILTWASLRREQLQLPTLYYWTIWSLLSVGWHGLGDVTDCPINTGSLAGWSVYHRSGSSCGRTHCWPVYGMVITSEVPSFLALTDQSALMKEEKKKKKHRAWAINPSVSLTTAF